MPTTDRASVRRALSPLTARFVLAVAVLFGALPAPAQDVATVRALLDAERAADALDAAQRLVERDSNSGEAWFLLSEARMMMGDLEAGRKALSKALKLAPDHRQAWLNRAALDMAEKQYSKALEALRTAQRLDPDAPDSYLNIGAVLLLSGQTAEAQSSFDAYVSRSSGDGDAQPGNAQFLVASNYAMAGYRTQAAAYLKQAIALNERNRLRIRTDPNFDEASTDPQIQALMLHDGYRPPAGSPTASQVFEAPYTGQTSTVLFAVVDVLQLAGRPVDPQVEVTPEWAVLWSDVRVKLIARGTSRTEVQLIGSPRTYSQAQWEEMTTRFFREVAVQLVSRS